MSSTTNFKDHFSGHAQTYRAARPGYPAALYQWLATQPRTRTCVWDVGCGNGQASVALAAHFERVIATDPSGAQIDNAVEHPRIEYRVERSEVTSIETASVDLVTVAQALHWFDHALFYAEARRVAKPGAVLAAWTYALCHLSPEIDAILKRLYDDIIGPYWPPERRYTEDGYASLPFPFAEIEAPVFSMLEHWSLPQFCAYLRTWSAVQRYLAQTGSDPVSEIEPDLTRAWGDPAQPLAVHWPLALRVGRLD